jgi:hypothetical protein
MLTASGRPPHYTRVRSDIANTHNAHKHAYTCTRTHTYYDRTHTRARTYRHEQVGARHRVEVKLVAEAETALDQLRATGSVHA